MGSAAMVRVVFILMALALAVGGLVGLFGTGVLGGSGSNPAGFVLPEDDDAGATPQPGATGEVRQYAGPPAMTIEPGKRYVATIKTALGDIEVELFAEQAPQTVNNFVFLARDGLYDGLVFHYVDQGFSANAGDPACTAAQSAGRNCDGGPGYELSQEKPGDFEKGTLGMINGSQFFVALSDSESDAERYEGFTPFGRIVSGLDVAEQLVAGTEIQQIEIQEQ
jgi:cyclophilin family peptidyl-prolyl cis-trans isomerase